VAYAQALIGQEKQAEAYRQYEAAISLSDDPKVKLGSDEAKVAGVRRDPALAQLHFEAGTSASVAGMVDRAEEHYWMAQVLDPGEARYPLYLAMVHIKKGDDGAAAASLVRAVKIKPDLAEAWGTMAELELKKNQLSLAGQHIETARKLQPEVTRWAVVQARVINRLGDPQKAAAILEALPPATRMDKGTLRLLAESYGLMQSPTQAAAMYEAAAKTMPLDAEIACAAAQWWERAGERAKAIEFARTAAMLGSEEGKDLLATLEKKKK
jgi:tetratricopeptide (TPR) repeat protein